MFGLIEKMFIGLLTGLVNGSNRTKCVLLSKRKCKIQPTLINLHPNECRQEFHYYPFAVKLDRCGGSLNLSVFNMNAGVNESETLTKHISCECKCKFDETKCNSDQWWNNNKC